MSRAITDQPTMVFVVLTEKDKEEIAKQIEEGNRPLNWRTAGHPDNEIWTKVLKLHPEAGVIVTI